MRRENKPIRTLAALILVAFVLGSGAALTPAEAQQGGSAAPSAQAAGTPEIEAESWALMDAESGKYLEGENQDEQLPLGSVTKIMSALVVLDEGIDLEEEVVISSEAESYVGNTYSNVGLIAGERVTVRDLLVASMVASGTEAVYALAEYAGDGSVENFVGMMNGKASELGLENTNFETPAGLDTAGNYSSGRDVAILSRAALQYPLFAEIVAQQEATISTQNREIEIFNTNQLLTTYPPTTGIKTGTTPQGGASLASSAEANGESFVGVILGAEDSTERFRASQEILEYAFGRYEQRALVSPEEIYGEVAPPYRPDESVDLAATEEVMGLVDAGSEVQPEVTTREELPPSAEAGDELGEVEVFVDGESVGTSPLVAQEGYEEASLWRKISYTAGDLLNRAQGALSGLTG
ncbi:MAG TPA: D-alanyl-D-alanine carboxypeptidase family protein [Rubrobacteraceae bacterium]|nr:D-alanyl-D-alanine carboxypeptidase family protein [Rubrobacteraceae bacterium]